MPALPQMQALFAKASFLHGAESTRFRTSSSVEATNVASGALHATDASSSSALLHLELPGWATGDTVLVKSGPQVCHTIFLDLFTLALGLNDSSLSRRVFTFGCSLRPAEWWTLVQVRSQSYVILKSSSVAPICQRRVPALSGMLRVHGSRPMSDWFCM